ncbi:SusC/RagA family TonB-linked outer membrane protein [Fulvivirga maritima]|uniref:SusC/RagA family TonB-linked outer membrane protein n=1 Tax=Fulvivirga maritima TaxID=2904247 RepID=UPI001F29CA3B|nr:SusC/RagA family TonB-linked outer membrane protein [Fulvivirga maritima]UII28825.1 SusC/RagA family TonB-linked outer membrane protein [Fulvivirga maritima]
MKNFLLVSFLLMFSFISNETWAQETTISGKVTSTTDGSSLPGVNVMVKGTSRGAVTDINGNYTVSVPNESNVLVFSFIGLATQEIEIGGRSTINVEMSDDAKQLSEVVVVGYGTTTKESFAGSMKQVDAELISKKSVSNVSQALAGEVAGVRIVNSSGQPGTEANVRIRGIGSVNGNSSPLYVVDGVPYFGSINAINPSNIASVTVLKDATATAIYGSRGANGVILINTLKGKAGESFVQVDAKYGQNFNLLPRYNTISSPEQYAELGWESLYNQGLINGNASPETYANENLFGRNGISTKYNLWNVNNGGELIDPTTGKVRSGVTRKYNPEDWEDYAFQASNRVEGTVKMGGGSEKVNYFTSFGYLNDIGYSINSDYERYSARVNVNHQVKEWLSGGVNLGYARSESNNAGQSNDSGSIFWFVDNIPSIYPLFLRDENGNKIQDPYYGGSIFDYGDGRGFASQTNAIGDATNSTNETIRHDLNGNANLTVDFTDWLSFETRYGWQYANSSNNQLGSAYYGSSASSNGSIYKAKTEIFTYNFTNLIRFRKQYGANSIEALIAHENNKWEEKFLSGSRSQLLDPFATEFNNGSVTTSLNSYSQGYSIESYFGQVNYDYKDTYYLTASIRRDGSSRFLKEKWGTFGALGAAWVASNESFLKDNNILTYFKLKASYGITGDQAGVGYYPGHDLNQVIPVSGTPSASFLIKGNPDLTWETSKMFQVGAEFTIGNYIDGSVDYYLKNTDDLIFNRKVGSSVGYSSVMVNGGMLRNTGIEFDLTGHLLNTNDAYIDLRLNGEIINNELKSLPIDPSTNTEKLLNLSGVYGRAAGHSIYDFYLREYAGVDSETGQALWNMNYDDLNGNNQYDEGEEIKSITDYLAENPNRSESILNTTTTTYSNATQKFVNKSAIPDLRGGISLSAGYKNFDLSILFLYSIGGYSYDGVYAGLMGSDQIGSNNWHKDMLNRWQNENDETDVPRLSNGSDLHVNSRSTRFLTKADYINLSNVRLGYTVPEKLINKIGIQTLNIFVSGDNLWLSSKRDGFNPSTSIDGSSSTYSYSPLSTVSIGANVKF